MKKAILVLLVLSLALTACSKNEDTVGDAGMSQINGTIEKRKVEDTDNKLPVSAPSETVTPTPELTLEQAPETSIPKITEPPEYSPFALGKSIADLNAKIPCQGSHLKTPDLVFEKEEEENFVREVLKGCYYFYSRQEIIESLNRWGYSEYVDKLDDYFEFDFNAHAKERALCALSEEGFDSEDDMLNFLEYVGFTNEEMTGVLPYCRDMHGWDKVDTNGVE